ncbi:MAG: 3-oxoacyl-ACP reductase family protein [Victivallaceae bacterium]|jgi:NAD(P)-dependent dehydrogenase (short-subunit alcohol dehydrogenase family)
MKNKTALVTGASNGIGKSIALMLAEEGIDVAISYFSDEKGAEDTKKKIESLGVKALVIQADTGKAKDIDMLVAKTLETFAKIDILVNNAGIFLSSDFFEISEEMFDRTIDVNLKGCFLMMQKVAKHMVQKGIHGRIVNISSALAVTGCEFHPHYAASKAGVNMLTKAGAHSLAPYGITVNAIMPGTIETNANRIQLSDEATAREILSRTPLKSYGKPENISEAVKYFISENAGWTTGSILAVDGGYLA